MSGIEAAKAAIDAVASGRRATDLEDATLEFKTDGRSANARRTVRR